jgi:hypothetical protein
MGSIGEVVSRVYLTTGVASAYRDDFTNTDEYAACDDHTYTHAHPSITPLSPRMVGSYVILAPKKCRDDTCYATTVPEAERVGVRCVSGVRTRSPEGVRTQSKRE